VRFISRRRVETGADNDPATLDQALRKIVVRRPEPAKAIIDKE
jgi:hypothetical protein